MPSISHSLSAFPFKTFADTRITASSKVDESGLRVEMPTRFLNRTLSRRTSLNTLKRQSFSDSSEDEDDDEDDKAPVANRLCPAV